MFPRPIPRPLPLAATERKRNDENRSVWSVNVHDMEQLKSWDISSGRDLKGHLIQHFPGPQHFIIGGMETQRGMGVMLAIRAGANTRFLPSSPVLQKARGSTEKKGGLRTRKDEFPRLD